MRLDVRESRELQATILALRIIDRTIAKKVRQYTKAVAEPQWKQALTNRANSRLEHRVIVNTATISVSNQNVRVRSAYKGRPLSGGLNPKTDYIPVEFGSNREAKTTYKRKGHPVTRRTKRQLKDRRKGGYVFWGAGKQMVPRLASLWVQTTVKTIANALEGKQE